MAYLVLARKWRPQRFEEVVGQEHVTTTLCNAIGQGRLAHAFLFSGPRGVGKTTVARLLARALNCAEGPTATPCGTCSSCVDVASGRALDVVEIDGASNTGVDNIRDLNDNVRYRPASGRFKTYIIDEVHMLSTAAFNALLKTLEEPPEHVKFIFATTEVQRLPPTVVSRCQRYEFKRIAIAEIRDRLRRIVDDESIEASDEALFALAREADGSMRDAQSLLDQVIVFASGRIDEEAVRAALGVADRALLHQMTEAILGRDAAAALQAVEALQRHGYEELQFMRDLVRQMRNLTVAAFFEDRSQLPDLTDSEIDETLRQAKTRTPEDLQRLFRVAQTGMDELRRSMLPGTLLEMTLVKMATLPDALPVDALISRLEELEQRLRGAGGAGAPRSGASRAVPERPVSSSRPASPAAPRPAAPVASRPATPTASRPVAPAQAPAGPAAASSPASPEETAEAGGGWPAFLAAAQSKVSLRLCLNQSRLIEETDDTLHIGVETTFARGALLHEETLVTLRGIAARCYGGPRRIKVSVVTPSSEELAERDATEGAKRQALTDRARALPSVRAAVEILGGELGEVKPRSAGGSDESR